VLWELPCAGKTYWISARNVATNREGECLEKKLKRWDLGFTERIEIRLMYNGSKSAIKSLERVADGIGYIQDEIRECKRCTPV